MIILFAQMKSAVLKFRGMVAIYRSFLELLFNLQMLVSSYVSRVAQRKLIANTTKVQFGSGKNYKPGFCNVDYSKSADLILDFRNPLPFNSRSIDLIYSEHMLEHLDEASAITHLKECYRILKLGGIMRLVLPDANALFKAYLNKDVSYFDGIDIVEKTGRNPNSIAILDYVNYAVYQYGQHKCLYDYEKLSKLLNYVGFKSDSIVLSEYRDGLDSSQRKRFSFYVEAKR